MKKTILLLTILSLSFISNAQVTQQQVPIWIVDEVLAAPFIDTVFPPNYTGRRKGAIAVLNSNQILYWYTGIYWKTWFSQTSPQNINSWQTVTTTFKQVVVGEGYIAESAGGVILNFLLPLNANVGDVFAIHGRGSGGWKITQNAGQVIHANGQTTTIGVTGYLIRQTRYDYIEIRCIAPNEFESGGRDGMVSCL